MSFHFSPRSNNPIYRWWWSIDRLNLMLIFALILFGIVMVGTASPSVATRIGYDSHKFLIKHILFLVPALSLLIGFSWLKIKQVWRLAFILYIVAAIGVLMTLIHGSEVKGATRWISFWGFSLQPSEFIKPGFIILSAWFLAKQKSDPHFPGLFIACGLYGLSAMLLLLQPDFGMFFVISVVFGMQIFLSGCPLRFVAILGGLGLLAVFMAYMTLDHVQSRVDRYLYPDAGGDTYQMDRSKEAFVNGGFMGTGLGQGTVKNQVPDVHADFIFTAVGEEFGFLLSSVLILAFAALYYRFFTKFSKSQSLFVMLGGAGLTFMLAAQSFIHMGSALQLIPAKGMTLPLISYGGSSLISVCASFGIMLALSRGIQDDGKRATWRHLTGKNI